MQILFQVIAFSRSEPYGKLVQRVGALPLSRAARCCYVLHPVSTANPRRSGNTFLGELEVPRARSGLHN